MNILSSHAQGSEGQEACCRVGGFGGPLRVRALSAMGIPVLLEGPFSVSSFSQTCPLGPVDLLLFSFINHVCLYRPACLA